MIFSATLKCFAESSFVQNDYDYSREGDISYNSVDIVGVLENLLSEGLSDIEKKYLIQNSTLSLNYSDTISISHVMTDYVENSLTVSAVPYTYKSVNARGVTWNPVSVNGNKMEKNGEKYSYTFEDIDENFGDNVSVKYEAFLQLNYKDINKYINYVFDMAKSATEKLEEKRLEYVEAERVYQENLKEYNEYLESYSDYLENYEEYRKYLIEYALWQDKVNAYNRYISEYETYQKELGLYNKYLEDLQVYNKEYQVYMEYLSLLDAYNKELAIYNEQTKSSEAQTTIYQLSILHYLTKPVTELKRTLYGAIMGGAVTQVLAEKEALVTVGKVEGRAVDLAASATKALRHLLTQYNTYTNDDDRYVFYILCQEELSKNFNDLFRALDFMYNEYPIVRKVINQMERKDQFEILLAQLYCICNALTNDKIPNYILVYKGKNASGAGYFDGNYKIGDGKKTVQSILGADGVLEDKNNATPLENGVPNLPKPPIKPTEVKMPVAPKRVNEPVMPIKVSKPSDKPTEVYEPLCPNEIVEPTAPVAYEPTDEEIELASSFETGKLQKRDLYTANVFYHAETTVQKYFRNVKVASVYFYDGATTNKLLYSCEAQLDSFVEFPREYPKKTLTGYTCTFDGWVDEDGNLVDLNRFSVDKSDVFLYPHFKETPNMYRVNWRIDSKTIYSDECAFGDIPVYDNLKFGEIQKDNNGFREYRFKGWKKGDKFFEAGTPLEIMTDSPVIYEAVFEESYVVKFDVCGVGSSFSYWYGEMPEYADTPTKNMDSVFVYEFKCWNKPLTYVTEDTTYVAEFDRTPLLAIKTASSIIGGTISLNENYFVADCQSSISNEYGVSVIFELAKSRGSGIKINLSGASLIFSPNIVSELVEKDIDKLNIYIANTSKYKYKYSLNGYNSTGEEIITEGTGVEISAYGVFDEENSYLYETTPDNDLINVRFSIENKVISFTLNIGSTYSIAPQNIVSVMPSEFIEISINKERATTGEMISITLAEPPKGMYIESVYLVAGDGSNIELSEQMTFKMPSCAVSVGVVCAYYEYTVTFKSEGKTISVRTYRYGDSVIEPSAPYKASDSMYIFDFVGWDNEVITVDGDAVYNAVYEARLLPEENIIPENTKLTKLLHLAYILIPVGVVVIVGLIVLIVFLAVKRHKKKRKSMSGGFKKK